MGIALAFAALFGAQTLVRTRLFDQPYTIANLLIESLTRWLLYAAFAPAVGALVARFPLERGTLARHAPIHLLGAAAFAALHSAGMGIVYRAFHVYPREDSLAEAIGRLLLTYFGVNVVVFCSISGVYHALRYHDQVRHREQLAASLRTRLAEARLDTLRAQLNPHFLFNTLNAVSTLAFTGERGEVVKTLSRLSDLLRISLDRRLPQRIPLDRELDMLDGYLDIQRVRFGDRLSVESRIDDAARDALFPSMMLQPLVENALQHGIEARPGPGRVVVAATRVNGRLRVRVEDSGPGFVAEPRTNDGIGLSNTRARLEELYGDAQSLECGNLTNGGAFVEVVVPFQPASASGAQA